MDDNYLRQSALATEALGGRRVGARGEAGIALDERLFPVVVNLRGSPRDKAFMAAAEKVLGAPPPTAPNSVQQARNSSILWLGPDEWWVVALPETGDSERRLADELRTGLAKNKAAVTEVGESRTCIRVSGPRARDMLTKGCALDLHANVFGGAGHCAQTNLAKATVVIHQTADDETVGPAFDVYVPRSFAGYLFRWLEDAAREYGVVVHSA